MAENIKRHITHIKSKVVENNLPKLPTASQIQDGEIAVNYAKGYETLSIKNESGNVVTFETKQVHYGTCSTAAGTAKKLVTVDEPFVLKKGVIIAVKFTYANSASNVTLNVNSTGDKSIYYGTSVYTGNSTTVCGAQNRIHIYMYDGTYWTWQSHNSDDNTTYSTGTSAILSAGTDTTQRVWRADQLKGGMNALYQPKGSYLTGTTKYAGASSQGGAATSANKLNSNAGSATQPIYFSNGVPSACTYTLGKSVPSDAVFTDNNTTYAAGSFITITGTNNSINVTTGTSSTSVARGDHSHSGYAVTGRSISTASGLTGGGNLSADRTLGLAAVTVGGYEGSGVTSNTVSYDSYGRVNSAAPIIYSAVTISANQTNVTCPTVITGTSKSGAQANVIYVNNGSTTKYTVSVSTTNQISNTGQQLNLKCPKSGYCEINYLNIGGVIYVRGA